MIQLRNNPIQGSSVKLGLSFRDPIGNYYIPVYVTYTVLALNNDKESWSVVDDLYKVQLIPASTINLTIPNVKLIEGTTLERKVIIEYQTFIDNEYEDFVDEVNFTIQPVPTVDYPYPPPEPHIYIKVVSCDLVAGSLTTAPLLPVFKLKTNIPSVEEGVSAVITEKDTGNEISCNITPDMTDTVFTIAPNESLDRLTDYILTVTGLESKFGGYPLESPYVLLFTTTAGDPRIQDEKEVTITENGTVEIEPDGDSEGIAKVIVNTEVPIEGPVTRTIRENGTITVSPSEGYTAIEEVTIETAIPLQGSKTRLIEDNGVVTILPDDGYTAMNEVVVDTRVPIEPKVSTTVSSDGVVTLRPSIGFVGMKEAVVTVNTGGSKSLYAYDGDNGLKYYSTRLITISGDYTLLPDPVNVDDGFGTYYVLKIGAEMQIEYKGAEVMLTRNANEDIMK